MGYLRRRPGTVCYLVVLLTSHLVVFHLLPEEVRRRVLRGISTNLSAIGWTAPLRLVASALVVDASGSVLNIFLIVFCGVVVSLGWLEYRLGGARAFGIFGAAHVLASLLVLAIAVVAVRTGRYPSEVADQLDYGISFGAMGAIGAVTWLVPRWVRWPWAAVALLYPLTAADWYGWLPDYATAGHVISVAAGLGIAAIFVRPRRTFTSAPAQGRFASR
jgi:hypothetical protein